MLGLVLDEVAVGQAFCEYCSDANPYYSANALHTRDIMCCYSRSILGYCIKGPCPTTPQKLKEVCTHTDVCKEHDSRPSRNTTSSGQR